MARVLVENQPSSEREKVIVAPTASSSVGSAAMIENSATMRMCSRAPGVRLPPRTRKPDDLPRQQRDHRDDQNDVEEQHASAPPRCAG